MTASRSASETSLFGKIDASRVLIKGERPIYNERLHWASLLSPFFETVGALFVVTIAFAPISIPSVLIGLAAVGYAYFRWKNPDPKRVRSRWAYGAFIVAVVVVAIAGNVTGNAVFGVGLIFVCAGRFVLRFIEWLWYERLFITNRRLILAKGLLGTDYSTLPLTRLTDINYNTTIVGEFLGYGLVRVETAGQVQALSKLNYLTDPTGFYHQIISLSTQAVGSVTEPEDNEE